KETHFGKEMWVIRKGATPAFKGQKSFVGGSMGDISVILEGIGCEEALHSTIHGAGRVMGRMQAKGKKGKKGLVDPVKHREWIKNAGVILRGGDLDESPYAYKRIEQVLKAHEGTVKILHTLTPIGVAMADSREFDPYKD
ncbi:MAG: RtcB family protein, partial [Parachlamydiaceae bacterium]